MQRHTLDIPGDGGTRRLSYLDSGGAENSDMVFCVHGLTRNGRDFERLAAALSGHARVICPDIAGRGQSDPLADAADYAIPNYVADLRALMAHLGAAEVDWVGTSMGGLIGMLAATGGGIRRLVLNDVGPFLPRDALGRIGDYVTRNWRFASLDEAEAHFRVAYAPFALSSDADWRWLTEISLRREGESWLPAYDPAIGTAFTDTEPDDLDLWPLWDSVPCPVLLLRGADSDVLPAATADEMTRRGPGATLVTFPGIGHAPALLDGDQIAAVEDWLYG